MCGPSEQMTALADQEASFSKTLMADYGTRFGKQSEVLDRLNHALSPIMAAGSSQQGFSPEERAARNTRALDTTSANYQHAARAIGGQLAGRGGDSGLESGIDQQIGGSLASDAARQLSDEQLAITDEDYATGRHNYEFAVGGEKALAGELAPGQFAKEATDSNASAYGQAKENNTQKNALMKDLAGAAVSIGTSFIPGGAGFKALSGLHKQDMSGSME